MTLVNVTPEQRATLRAFLEQKVAYYADPARNQEVIDNGIDWVDARSPQAPPEMLPDIAALAAQALASVLEYEKTGRSAPSAESVLAAAELISQEGDGS